MTESRTHNSSFPLSGLKAVLTALNAPMWTRQLEDISECAVGLLPTW